VLKIVKLQAMAIDLICHWPNMSCAVNKYLSVDKKTFRKIFGIDRLWLDFDYNTNHTKKRIQTTFITLNSTPTGLFTAADLTSFDTVILCTVQSSYLMARLPQT